MATAEQIPSDLALELGDELTPESFLRATRAFFGYVREIGNALSEEAGERPKWRVRVHDGSAVIGLVPAPSVPIEVVNRVYNKTYESVGGLLNHGPGDSEISESATRFMQTLSEVTNPERQTETAVRLWIRKRPLNLGPELARHIREGREVNYHDYGTIEGRLEAIHDNGNLQLRVRDALLRTTVRCYVPEYKLQEALAAFRQRVEVSGNIHYRRDGLPISIEVANIDVLPSDETLPTIADVRGILAA